MNEILVSIIIPVYKVEKQLQECVDSVLNQTYKNLEVILVDDGSPDTCPMICDEYRKKDGRIQVIHKENGGLSDARNRGIEGAAGEYVLFLDGDDFYGDAMAIENLVKRVQKSNADVLNFSYVKYDEDTDEKIPYFSGVNDMPDCAKTKEKQLEYMTKNGLYIASACNKMIRRTVISDKLLFEKGVFSEDIEWCAKILYQAENIDFVCENFYYYRQRQDSIRHTIDDKKCQDLCNNILKCFEIAEKAEDRIKKYLYRYIAFQYGTFFLVQAQAENKQTECIDKLKDYKWVLKYDTSNKKIMYLNIACKLIGYRNLCRLIRCLYHKK